MADRIGSIDEFWRDYLASLPPAESGRTYLEAFAFGDTAGSADRLADLVLRGIKTATSELLWSREATGKPLWRVGDESIFLDGSGQPVGIIRTTDLRIVPFNQVDERFVRDYGEGDLTLDWWQREMWDHYHRECLALGGTPTKDIPLICERFEVVHPRRRDPHPEA